MIIAHVIGINSYLKSDFVTRMNELNIDVIDLDEITKKLLIEHKFNLDPEIWKVNLTNQLINSSNSKNTIVIGLTNFINDNRYKIKLQTEDYFFINIPINTCITQIITHNLDVHRQSIISGDFPLKFLNRSFIESQREQLEEIYVRTHKKINYVQFIEWVKDYIKSNHILYVTSLNRYETTLDSFPYAYNEEWMALSSIVPRTMITRGIQDGTPIIKEKQIGGFAELNKPGYVYEIKNQNTGKLNNNSDPHRTKITNLDFIKRRYISNIFDELKRQGVIFENFKY